GARGSDTEGSRRAEAHAGREREFEPQMDGRRAEGLSEPSERFVQRIALWQALVEPIDSELWCDGGSGRRAHLEASNEGGHAVDDGVLAEQDRFAARLAQSAHVNSFSRRAHGWPV